MNSWHHADLIRTSCSQGARTRGLGYLILDFWFNPKMKSRVWKEMDCFYLQKFFHQCCFQNRTSNKERKGSEVLLKYLKDRCSLLPSKTQAVV